MFLAWFYAYFLRTFTIIYILSIYVEFLWFLLNFISVFHKNYEQISTTLILRGNHYTIKIRKVRKNESSKRRDKPKGGHSLLRPRLNGSRGENDMLDTMTLLWIGLGELSLAFAFVHYAYSYRKRVKTNLR
jgi:hypothetical protein